jgi:hypothetical protein
MKTKSILIGLFLVMISSVASAQSAKEGKAVVARGFEHSNRIRFGALRPYEVGQYLPPIYAYVDSLIDSLGVNVTEDWPAVSASKSFYSNQKVICAGGPWDNNLDTNLNGLAWAVRQRIYTSSPSPLQGDEFGEHHFRYNDLLLNAQSSWHYNTYDSNDISPYAEYPSKDSIVQASFITTRFDISPNHAQLPAYYGNEGRVILGYSDDRIGTDLLATPAFYPFRSNPAHPDTAKAFSVNLEFWLDTTTVNIDTAKSTHNANIDSIPLVRLQVLYKRRNQNVLPFVPFKDATHPANTGWYKCLDTIITRSIYNGLPDDWRADDSTFNNSGGHRAHNWRCKQLHAMIAMNDSIITNAKKLVDQPVKFGPTGNSFTGTDFQEAPTIADHPLITTYQHPDSLVKYGTSISDSSNQLIEIRVLSMYRTTVRVRDVTYQDTMVDRYLNRRRFGDSTHSVEQSGAYGGNDSLANAAFSKFATLLGSNVPRELMYNDNGGSPGAAFPMLGYLDYMGSRYQIYAHSRPQDAGAVTQYFRRARMSFDGQPPSIIENQHPGYTTYFMPYDYLYYGHRIDYSKRWGASQLDSLMGQVIVRSGDTTGGSGLDTLQAYRRFMSDVAIGTGSTFRFIRGVSRASQWHPWCKRFASEYSIKSFSYTVNDAHDSLVAKHTLDSHGHDSVYYADSVFYRGYYDATLGEWIIPKTYIDGYGRKVSTGYDNFPLTPEMITTAIYGSFASGATAVSAGEAFGNAGDDVIEHDMGPFSPAPHSDSNLLAGLYEHNYNVGHYYTCRQWPLNYPYESDVDGPLPKFYLGMSNTYRALQLGTNRMSAIWNAGPYPVKNFRWLDSYDQYETWSPWNRIVQPASPGENPDYSPIGTTDSIARINAFLKVVKTQPVDPWHYGSNGEFRDSTGYYDDSTQTMALIGMFIDSLNSSTKNYAALVINPRAYPGRDTADINYYNAGLDSISKRYPTLGDIDVRKIYLKLDTLQFPSSFRTTYYVVRDLWHSDSTWLVHKDSTFAIYLKPGDAKFLYIEKGIAVNVASKTGTDTGKSSMPEFGFNNGRRVAERLNGTRSVVTYTRRNKLYVAYPAAGSTYAGTDQSSGDNIITGFEQALDTTHAHFCARPSISVASNDSAVALTYWYKDTSTGLGHVVAMFQDSSGASWKSATYTDTTDFPDTTTDLHWVTPVIAPVNDTAWVVLAGYHPKALQGSILALDFIVPHSGTPYFRHWSRTLANDITVSGQLLRVLFPTVTSRPLPDSLWPVRFAYQMPATATHNDIYFSRIKYLPTDAVSVEIAMNVSAGLAACDNLHPSLALNGTVQKKIGIDYSFYDDNLAWETQINQPGTFSTGFNYWPVIRARHEEIAPFHLSGSWGAFDLFQLSTNLSPFHYPNIAAEMRRYDGHFSYSGTGTVHDWIRMGFDYLGGTRYECWSPAWRYFSLSENGYFPTLPQTTSLPGMWTDSAMVPHSITFLASDSQRVRITNGWFPFAAHTLLPNVRVRILPYVDTSCPYLPVIINPLPVSQIPSGGGAINIIQWSPIDPAQSGPDEAWTNPEGIPNVLHTDKFAVGPCDSIIIPRQSFSNGFSAIQAGLHSSSDYLMWRMTLRHGADSSWIGTIDSMIITTSTIHWATADPSIDSLMARYAVPCTHSPDSVFVMAEILRGDTANLLRRYIANMMDTVTGYVPAMRAQRSEVKSPMTQTIALAIHPNPSNGLTHLDVTALSGAKTTIEIYDMLGQKVAMLYDNAGASTAFSIDFDASRLPSGTYLVRMQSGDEVITRQVKLVR